MAELSVAQHAVLAQMLERSPDGVLKALSAAVAQMPGARARALSQMLDEETLDRRRRSMALAPLIPMFRARPDGVEATRFPAAVLPRLWKAAAAREAELLPLLDDRRPIEDNPEAAAVADRLCVAAARAVRDQPDLIWPDAGSDAADREAGLAELTACLDLALLARRGLALLPSWIQRPTEEQLAELRLLIRDSAEIAPDGGPRMIEILFSHLADAAMILRVVVHSSHAAGREGVLSKSEMAVFVNRLIGEVEDRVSRIAAVKPGAGPDPGVGLHRDIGWCAETLAELDSTLQMDPDGTWGRRSREARDRINRTLLTSLKSVDRALDKVMPTRRAQTSGRMTRLVPDLDQPVTPAATQSAVALLMTVAAIRTAATVFGCEAQRSQLVRTVIDRITGYVDQIVEAVNGGEVEDPSVALGRVETLARLLLLIEAAEPARTVRRRAAAAAAAWPPTGATPERSPRVA